MTSEERQRALDLCDQAIVQTYKIREALNGLILILTAEAKPPPKQSPKLRLIKTTQGELRE